MSTLLTLKDVGENLGCSEVMVQRLIALGVLKAAQLNEGSVRSFRVSKPQLEAYINAGSPRFALPVGGEHLANNDGWFSDKEIGWIGKLFDGMVMDKLASLLPEPEDKLPAGIAADPKGGTFRKVAIDVAENEIAALLTMPVPYGKHASLSANMPGRKNFEGQFREAFLVDRFWSSLRVAASKREGTMDLPTVRSLYQLPESFNRLVDEAWQDVERGWFNVTRRYHLTFTESRYRDPVANLVSQSEAVQTIEVELMLKMARVADGAKASVVKRAL